MLPKPNKNPGDPNSYRPLSLTNTNSWKKSWYLNQTSLPECQAGFRPGIEMADQLLQVLTPFQNISFVTVITADIQKAFDPMWHDGLRLKLTKL